MKGAENGGGIAALVFQDIYLTGGGPATIDRILWHQPESRPVSFSLGQSGAKFKAAIFLIEPAASFEFGRGVARALIGLFQCDDVQQAIGDINIFCTAGVVLQLVISPSWVRRSGADIERPMCRVERDAIEFFV